MGVTKSIYIIRNVINDKVYIGQSIHPQERFKQHLKESLSENPRTVLSKAIKKHGINNFYIEILEKNIYNYNEREKYWINFFNSLSPCGYNISQGGENPPVKYGEKNNLSKLTELEVAEIKNLLISPFISMLEIAKFFGVSFNTIKNINMGYSWKKEKDNYPIRDFSVRLGNVTIETIQKVLYDIENSEMSFRNISKKYNVSKLFVSRLNGGFYSFLFDEEKEFPIRESLKIGKEKSLQIKQLLAQGILSKNQIAKKMKVSISSVNALNSGRSFFDKDLIYPIKKREGCVVTEEVAEEIRLRLKNGWKINKIVSEMNLPNFSIVYDINTGKSHKSKNYSYPIQEKKNYFSEEFIKKITHEIYYSKKSLNSIAKDFKIPKSTVICLKNGIWNKYRLPNYTYPLRKNTFCSPVSTISAKESKTTIDT